MHHVVTIHLLHFARKAARVVFFLRHLMLYLSTKFDKTCMQTMT